MSAAVILCCGLLRNFMVDTRREGENYDDEYLEQPNAQIEENEPEPPIDPNAQRRFDNQLLVFKQLNNLV